MSFSTYEERCNYSIIWNCLIVKQLNLRFRMKNNLSKRFFVNWNYCYFYEFFYIWYIHSGFIIKDPTSWSVVFCQPKWMTTRKMIVLHLVLIYLVTRDVFTRCKMQITYSFFAHIYVNIIKKYTNIYLIMTS